MNENEDGFTLIELLVVVAIMGIVFLAIGAMFSTSLIVHKQSERRVTDAQDEQRITTYFGDDVQGAATASTPTGAVVEFVVKDFDASYNLVSWKVSYKMVGTELHRIVDPLTSGVQASDNLIAISVSSATFVQETSSKWKLVVVGKDLNYSITATRRLL